MGIPGLFQFLKNHEIMVNIASYITNKRVGVDLFWYLYKTKGDIDKLRTLLASIEESAASVIYILDGKPTKERSASLEGQRKKREEGHRVVQSIEEFLLTSDIDAQQRAYLEKYIHNIKQQIWSPSPQYIEEVISTLKSYNIRISGTEADETLAAMYKSGELDIVISPDSDLIRLGVLSLLRPNRTFSNMGIYYDIASIYPKIQLTEEQWKLFLNLCHEYKTKEITNIYTLVYIYKEEAIVREKYQGLSNGSPL